jgi:hypothetical protein
VFCSLVSKGSLEDLHLELSPENLASLVLGQGLHEHDSAAEFLVRRHALRHVVYNLLLLNTAVPPNDVSAGKFSGALIRNAHHGNVVHAFETTDQVFQL